MTTYEKHLQKTFVTEGGIKERMKAARLNYRTNQQEEISRLQQELEDARQEIERLKGLAGLAELAGLAYLAGLAELAGLA